MTMILSLVLMVTKAMGQDETPYDNHNQVAIRWIEKTVGHDGPSVSAPQPIKDKELLSATSGRTYHWLHFSEFPVARRAPDPFGMRNVLVVDSEQKVVPFKSRDLFRKDFLKAVQPLQMEQLKEFALGYLKVSTMFSQDGYFTFVYDLKNVQMNRVDESMSVRAVSPVVEKSGDTGNLTADFVFKTNDQGRMELLSIKETDTIKPGIRPICQCTLLLDENPLVREIAERDLLVMGEAAIPYIEDKMKTLSPALQKECRRVIAAIRRGDRLVKR